MGQIKKLFWAIYFVDFFNLDRMCTFQLLHFVQQYVVVREEVMQEVPVKSDYIYTADSRPERKTARHSSLSVGFQYSKGFKYPAYGRPLALLKVY